MSRSGIVLLFCSHCACLVSCVIFFVLVLLFANPILWRCIFVFAFMLAHPKPLSFSLCLCIFVFAFMLANLDAHGWWGCEEVSGCMCHLSRHCSTPSLALTGSPLSFLKPLCSQDPPTCSLLGPHPFCQSIFPSTSASFRSQA